MATIQNTLTVTLEAGADLSAKQFFFVVVAADGQVDPVGSAGGDADGILMNKPAAAGRPAEVAVGGIAKVECGGSVSAGDKLQSDGSGNALTAASGDHVLAKALEDGEDGEVISCLLVSKHILA